MNPFQIKSAFGGTIYVSLQLILDVEKKAAGALRKHFTAAF